MGKNKTFVLLFAFVLLFSLVGIANAAEIDTDQMKMNNSAAVSETNDEQAGMMDDRDGNSTVDGNGNMMNSENEIDTTDEENSDMIGNEDTTVDMKNDNMMDSGKDDMMNNEDTNDSIDGNNRDDENDRVDREENNDQIRDFPGYRMVPYNANNSYFNCSWNNRPQRYNGMMGMMGGYR